MKLDWIELDVRPVLATGREPFALIMNNLETLEPGQGLRLTAPFYPAPLVEMLSSQGWAIESHMDSDNEWVVSFERIERESAEAGEVLDLRDLPPPEPMIRILEHVERLEAGVSLVALTPFYPDNLFPVLEERGFTWEATREAGESCRITIRQA